MPEARGEAEAYRSGLGLATKQRTFLTAIKDMIGHISLIPRLPVQLSLSLAILFLFAFTMCSGSVFVQYASKTLGWPIATRGYVILLNGLVMPGVLFGLAVGPLRIDVTVVWASAGVLALGVVMVGLGGRGTGVGACCWWGSSSPAVVCEKSTCSAALGLGKDSPSLWQQAC